MQGLAVVLFPVLLMLFALAMERVEFRLARLRDAVPVRTFPNPTTQSGPTTQLTHLPPREPASNTVPDIGLRRRRAS